ncbi:MAG TPA: endonuclease/exonuclease/phosphatase family protein [Sedimentisphaerales bacterium]|jgi:endonuclease/exonuclease/phosphatase family metal-dependent hydrolase|nr:endonuclease/exonuclease/phosphatase family protein [Sedimentisphaerales bacterium]HNU31495.1 endonuclease/exonuclease/phosphatase family protein [Sedimentisphaerales bacterium]
MRLATIAKRAAAVVALTALLLAILVWFTTFHPRDGQSETVFCDANTPTLKSGQTVKVLSYNVQFMAGRGYLFFFELPNDAGPDERPLPADVARTTDEVARIIREEDPDIVLLQEVDDGAKRTGYADQLHALLSKLPAAYSCHTSTFYWKAGFVPHGRIMGSVGMKLSTISKYRIGAATRHTLAPVPRNVLVRQFHPKRAILETRLPVEGGKDLVVLNLHLEAFPEGSDVMRRQVQQLDGVLTRLCEENCPFVGGGDFNLLPPGQRSRLRSAEAIAYREDTEMALLYTKYRVIPSLADVDGPMRANWFTHFPNGAGVAGPDRTIDYFVLSSQSQVLDAHVRQSDTLEISDHLPLIVVLRLDL